MLQNLESCILLEDFTNFSVDPYYDQLSLVMIYLFILIAKSHKGNTLIYTMTTQFILSKCFKILEGSIHLNFDLKIISLWNSSGKNERMIHSNTVKI